MGCDIHLRVEKRQGDKWVKVDGAFYDNRNYGLFAILADVRNGYGFAGCDMGDRLTPISAPRGLPRNADESILVESSEWGIDGHSHSWFTVRELMEYDWTQVATRRGFVNGTEYINWSGYSENHGYSPHGYCGDVAGHSIRKVSRDEMDMLIKNGDDITNTYCKVEWKTPYYRLAGSFMSETMPRLWRIGSPDNVRIVFWFDN